MALTTYINIDLGNPIWRMQIDSEKNILCLETRNAIQKTTSFSAIDLKSGNVFYRDLVLPQGWQCGLDAAAFGVMLVHGYQSELLPVSKGLTAIDASTGTVLWENFNISLERVITTGLEVYDNRLQPKRLHVVDAHSGQIITPTEPSSEPESYIIYPGAIDYESIKETGLLNAVEGHTALFLSHNQYRIVSLHALSGGIVNQYLYVLDQAGNVVLEDIIAQNIQKLQPEAFIVFKQKLIWLQNRSVVKVLHL